MGGLPVEFVWHDDPGPAGLPVTQVYGWLLCSVSGRVLIQEQDDGTFSLPGGTPEPYRAWLGPARRSPGPRRPPRHQQPAQHPAEETA